MLLHVVLITVLGLFITSQSIFSQSSNAPPSPPQGTSIPMKNQEVAKQTSTASSQLQTQQQLVFDFNQKAFSEKYWEWNGEWRLGKDGGKASKGPSSFLRTRHAYTGNVIIDMDFSLGQAEYMNTSGCWITVWGEPFNLSKDWGGVQAKVHIYRDGDSVVFILNGKEKRMTIDPKVRSKPTRIDVYWRNRTSHFRKIEIKADSVMPGREDTTKPPRP